VRGTLSFEIVFSLSAESILTVTAEDKQAGKSVTATFSTKDTPEEVKKRLVLSDVAEERVAPPEKSGGFGGFMKRLFGSSKSAG